MNLKSESEIFNKAAEYYDEFRPGYPQKIIDWLINETDIKCGSKILEIGAGSGKATEQIARKGFDITCVEPGEDLVLVGEKKFKGDSVKYINARFEDIELKNDSFDVVFAAQSFHWVPQPQGFEKCSSALKEKGHLAILYNMYILTDSTQDKELYELSVKYGGFADFIFENKCDERISSIISDIEYSDLFSNIRVFRVPWIKEYTAEEYHGFVLTGNKILQKNENEKAQIYTDIKCLADKFGGMIKRPYLCVLYIAEKRATT